MRLNQSNCLATICVLVTNLVLIKESDQIEILLNSEYHDNHANFNESQEFNSYEFVSNSPLMLLSLLSALIHGFLFTAMPIIIFALNKQKTVNLIKSKMAQ